MKRDIGLSEIKGLLIILVVFGHLVQTNNTSLEYMRNIYISLYTFHMFVFSFISGFAVMYSDMKGKKAGIKMYLIYTIIAQLGYSLISYYKDGVFLDFYSLLWYLEALTIWLILHKIYKKFNISIKKVFLFSILFSIGIGFINTNNLYFPDLRVFTHYPLYLLGYLIHNYKTQLLNKNTELLIFSFIMSVLISIPLINIDLYDVSMRIPYSSFIDCLQRIYIMSVGILGSFTLYNFFTNKNKRTILSDIGHYSLFIYIGHGWLIKLLNLEYNNILKCITFTIIYIIICYIIGYIWSIFRKKLTKKLKG